MSSALEEQLDLILAACRRQGVRLSELEGVVQAQARRIDALERPAASSAARETPLTPLVPVYADARTYVCTACQNRIYGNWPKCPHCSGVIVEK